MLSPAQPPCTAFEATVTLVSVRLVTDVLQPLPSPLPCPSPQSHPLPNPTPSSPQLPEYEAADYSGVESTLGAYLRQKPPSPQVCVCVC